VFAAPRVVLVLQTREEPWASVSVWEDGTFHQDRLTAEPLEAIVPEALAESGFIRRAAGDVLVADERGRLSNWRGSLLSPALAGYSLERVLSVPINSEHATGRLFVADKQDVVREELALAWVVAVQIGLGLDRMQVIEAAQQSAATEERLRLARDLHDGILQTLAGTALQLETVKRLADQDPASVRPKIDDMQSWLLSEQREMREFIGRLRPAGVPAHPGPDEDYAGLPALVQALEQQWGVAITAPAEAAHLVVSTGMEFQLRHIVREAVANAVRHGGASQISLQAKVDDGALRLAIIDNGRGLPVHGQFDERQSAQGRIGPQSLRERIVGLGGSLLIDSTPAGVTLSIQLPLRSTDARDSDRPDRR
jgi:signal transduction histidine kinase